MSNSGDEIEVDNLDGRHKSDCEYFPAREGMGAAINLLIVCLSLLHLLVLFCVLNHIEFIMIIEKMTATFWMGGEYKYY